MSVFQRGYNAVREEVERNEQRRKEAGSKIFRFYPPAPNEEAEIRFLTEEPINFYEHMIQIKKGGKTQYENHICKGDDCPYCEEKAPSFKGAYLVYDFSVYEDKEGKEQESGLRLLVMGQKVLSQLDRLSSKYGITNRNITLVRTGAGQSTSYVLEKGEKEDLFTEDDIAELLPESLRDMYNGSMDSLYDIIQHLLEEEVEKEVDTKSYNKNIIGADDEEEKPKSKFKGRNNSKQEEEKPKSRFGGSKKKEEEKPKSRFQASRR